MDNKYDILDERLWGFFKEIRCGDITFDELDKEYKIYFDEDERHILDNLFDYLKCNWGQQGILLRFFTYALNRIDDERKKVKDSKVINDILNEY